MPRAETKDPAAGLRLRAFPLPYRAAPGLSNRDAANGPEQIGARTDQTQLRPNSGPISWHQIPKNFKS